MPGARALGQRQSAYGRCGGGGGDSNSGCFAREKAVQLIIPAPFGAGDKCVWLLRFFLRISYCIIIKKNGICNIVCGNAMQSQQLFFVTAPYLTFFFVTYQ